MKIVYYSLAPGFSAYCENQWIQSIRSLRRYNTRVPVHLLVYNAASPTILSEAARQSVRIQNLGDYSGYLQSLHLRGAILALLPTLHKLISLGHLFTDDASQVLFLDCDTFVFHDVEDLFDIYRECDWYAREEPSSSLSYLGLNIDHLDEKLLAAVCWQEGLRFVAPFNSGVYVLNNQFWDRIVALRFTFLDYAWRLLVGRYLWLDGTIPDVEHELGHAVRAAVNEFDRSRALRYPSNNFWIVEQIALWLTLGHIPGLSQGLLLRDHVAQSSEFTDALQVGSKCVVAHYFNSMERDFFSRVPAIPA